MKVCELFSKLFKKGAGKMKSREQMFNEHRYCSVYIDADETLYSIPCGWNQQLQSSVSIDILDILPKPYNNNILEDFLLESMGKCYSIEKEDYKSIGALEKHLNVKKWTTAVKGKKLVTFFWNYTEGYQIVSHSVKGPRDGYTPMFDKRIVLGFEPNKGEISEAFLKALSESCPYPS